MITVFNWTYRNKKSGIYAIYNTANGKIYIGSAINLHRRLVDHIYFLNLGKHHSILLQRAWDKYGSGVFEFYVLEYVNNKNELVDREQYWMDLNNCSNPLFGYNISPTAGNCLGVKHSDEVRAARSKALTGIIRSTETRAKMSASRKGVKIHSDEAKLKISLAGKNRNVSEATRLKLSEAGKKRKHSEATIEKLKSIIRKNSHRVGVKHSEETKKRMSEAQRKRHSADNQWR